MVINTKIFFLNHIYFSNIYFIPLYVWRSGVKQITNSLVVHQKRLVSLFRVLNICY